MHIENFRIGQWFVVTGKKPKKSPPLNTYESDVMIQHVQHHQPDDDEPTGIPLKIRAISLPFVAAMPATNPNTLTTIDISRYEIRKADAKYVQVFKDTYNLQLALTKGMITEERQV